MSSQPSPFAPATYPTLPAIQGVRMAVAHTNMRYQNRADLLLVELAKGTSIAGVFTRSNTAGACIHWGREALAKGNGKARAIVVNAGIANVCNGKAGMQAVEAITSATAARFNTSPHEIFHSATGIIGQTVKEALILEALPKLEATLTSSSWEAAARAICTTDTFPKLATRSTTIDGVTVTLNGFIKGSGMIAPNMATMLGYLFTDAVIAPQALQAMLADAVEKSFHAITVDSDTSTSDTILLCATNQAPHAAITEANDPRARAFRAALQDLSIELAKLVVKDGEGISKFITIDVKGAVTPESARRHGLAIANSPLVKTAIAGEDANWGRIAMAIGKCGEPMNAEVMSIAMGGIEICTRGELTPGYDEAQVAAHLKGREIQIEVNVGEVGQGAATIWTCDLTHEYIAINADYRS